MKGNIKASFNVEAGGYRVKNAGKKVGILFGKKGRIIGMMIDILTEKITVRITKER